jgi:hypothetical protein
MNGEDTTKNVEKRYTDPVTGKFIPGNPGGGRTPGTLSLVSMLKKKLEEIEPTKKRTYAELFIDEVVTKALDGEDSTMKRDIINRIDGMPKQQIEFPNGLDIIHNIELDEQTKKLVEEFVEWRKKTNK